MSKPPIRDSGEADGASNESDPSKDKNAGDPGELPSENVDGDLPLGMPVSADEYKKLKEKSKKTED